MASQISKVKIQKSKVTNTSTTLQGSKGGQATSHSASSASMTMAELMAKHQNTQKSFKKGDLVEGTVKKLTKSEITVDINGKSDAIVLEKDRKLLHGLLSTLKVGDKVTVSILNPESEHGIPVVSLRRYMSGMNWGKLEEVKKNQTLLDVVITESTKGGYVVESSFGVSGFLPNSHISFSQNQQLTLGKTVTVSVFELNKPENKVIFSQKANLTTKEFDAAAKQLKKQKAVSVTVTNVTTFGIFVTIPLPSAITSEHDQEVSTLDGLVHISEVSWEKVDDLAGMFTQGQTFEAIVIGVDLEARRVDLSIKRLTDDPFAKTAKQFPVDTKVQGVVEKIDDNGVHVRLGNGVQGLIRKDKVPPTMKFEVGKSTSVTVSEVDQKRHRILLVPVLLDKPIGYR